MIAPGGGNPVKPQIKSLIRLSLISLCKSYNSIRLLPPNLPFPLFNTQNHNRKKVRDYCKDQSDVKRLKFGENFVGDPKINISKSTLEFIC